MPAEECFEREAEEKGVLFKGGRKYSKVSVMFTANFECSLTGGKLQFGRLFVCLFWIYLIALFNHLTEKVINMLANIS